MSSSRVGVAACLLALQTGFSHQVAVGAEPCGWLGVTVTPMTAAIAESLGMTEVYGAIFGPPDPGSPAAAAGIEQGDVLTAVNGVTLVRAGDFAGIIAAMAPSTPVVLDTLRDSQGRQVRVPLGAGPCRTGG